LPASNLPLLSNLFTSREIEINRIERAFTQKKIIVVLSSFPGVGKTCLAIEFAYRFQKDKNKIAYWMKAKDNNLDYEFESFAMGINRNYSFIEKDKSELIEKDKRKLIRSLTHFLNLYQNKKILFVFDDCNDYKNIGDYISAFSSLKNVFILITTRDSQLIEMNVNYIEKITLDPFNKIECYDYLRKSLTSQLSDTELHQLMNLFVTTNDSIRPIILDKIIAFLKLNQRPFMPLSQFIKEIEQNENFNKINFEQNNIFDIIQSNDQIGWEIMKVSSFLDVDFVPIDFFTQILFDFDVETLENSLKQLQKVSILQIDKNLEKFGIKIHRSLQSEIQDYLKFSHPEELDRIIIQLAEKLTIFLDKGSKIHRENGWNQLTYYFNFIKVLEKITLNNHSSPSKELANLCLSFGEYIYNFELDYEKSIEYFNKALSIFQSVDSCLDKNSNFLKTSYYIGMALSAFGDNFKAVEHFESFLSILEGDCRDEAQAYVSKSYNNLGVCYYRLAQPHNAKKFLDKSLSITESLKNKDELSLSYVYSNIGIFYSLFGNSEEALKNLKLSKNINEKYGDEQNLEIALNLDYIGITYADLGNFQEALDHFFKALSIKKAIYRNENSSQLVFTLNNISNSYAKLNNNEKANNFSQQSLVILKNLKTDYYSIVGSIQVEFNLGLICLNSKNFFNANEYFEKSRVSFEKFFKTSKNVYVAECYNFIGLSKFHLNEIEEAKKFFDKSLEIYNYFLISEINLRTVQVYSNLTMYYRKLNNSQEESKYNEKVSFIKNQIHKEIQNLRNFGLQIEEKVGNYTLKEKIGSGGFGNVYMVEHNINKNM